MSTILVTGINGFVAPYVKAELQARGHTVLVTGHQPANGQQNYIQADLMKLDQVTSLPWPKIDAVVQLAGLSNQADSFDKPEAFIHVNPTLTLNLFEAALAAKRTPKIIAISSGAVYAPAETEQDETAATRRNSPYTVSKLATEMMVEYYQARGFKNSLIVRPFNHIGPGQRTGFILPDLASQVAAVAAGKQTTIQAGNLQTKRDYTDVRDVARAYADLVEHDDASGIYNVCSGSVVSGQEIVDLLVDVAGIAKPKIKTESNKLRPTDVPVIVGSHKKLTDLSGWQPKIGLRQSVSDIYQEWAKKLYN